MHRKKNRKTTGDTVVDITRCPRIASTGVGGMMIRPKDARAERTKIRQVNDLTRIEQSLWYEIKVVSDPWRTRNRGTGPLDPQISERWCRVKPSCFRLVKFGKLAFLLSFVCHVYLEVFDFSKTTSSPASLQDCPKSSTHTPMIFQMLIFPHAAN